MKPTKLTFVALAAGTTIVLAMTVNAQINPGSPTGSTQALAGNRKPGAANWLTDFSAARQQAMAGRKDLLLDFTGSDWCPWCMKLDREILETPEFRDFADKHLVLVKVDFPMHHSQSTAELAQNEQLAAQFQVQGYPTLVVLNPQGQEIGSLGYMSGGQKPFLNRLQEIIAD